MTKSRTWTIGTAFVVVLILVAGWFLAISPKRGEASELKATTAETLAQNESTRAQIRQLEMEQKNLPAQRAEIAAIKRQLPDKALQPAYIRQLVVAANASDVELDSITPAALASVPGATGVAYMGTTIVTKGSFSSVKAFLNELEENQRSLLVSGFTIAEDTDPAAVNQLILTVTARAFVITSSGETAATTGAAPTPGASAGTGATSNSAAAGSDAAAGATG